MKYILFLAFICLVSAVSIEHRLGRLMGKYNIGNDKTPRNTPLKQLRSPQESCAATSYCWSSQDCPDTNLFYSSVCYNSTCQSPQFLTPNTECDYTDICLGGYCSSSAQCQLSLAFGCSCTSDQQCGSGQCIDSTCGEVAIGDKCQSNEKCAAGVCSGGKCKYVKTGDSCSHDYDCDLSDYCSGSICTPYDKCSSTAIEGYCDGAKVCVLGECIGIYDQDIGETCYHTVFCKPGLNCSMTKYQCVDLPDYSPCESTQDCNLYTQTCMCEDGYSGTVCVPYGPCEGAARAFTKCQVKHCLESSIEMIGSECEENCADEYYSYECCILCSNKEQYTLQTIYNFEGKCDDIKLSECCSSGTPCATTTVDNICMGYQPGGAGMIYASVLLATVLMLISIL